MPALLFDIDGTLLHSDPLHFQVFRDVFAEHGVGIEEEDYPRHILGRTNALIFGHFLPGKDATALAGEKEARFRARLGGSFPPAPGLLELLDRAEAAGWPVAAVTNGPPPNAAAMIAAIGCTDRFPLVIAEGDFARGKPAPDPYLLALQRLGVAAGEAVAFEDSLAGVASAAAAGILTVGMRSSLSDAALRGAGAALTLADFADPALSRALAPLAA